MIVPVTCRSAVVLLLAVATVNSLAYPRYKDNSETPGSNCSECHGDFSSTNSPKGTIFPSGSKHVMHNGNSSMNTDCRLCHVSIGDNPQLNNSAGTGDTPGLGCSGCHVGPGLRAHHAANGVLTCYSDVVNCHGPDTAPPENVSPPYYGSVDTLANNPCNDVAASGTNENWSVGDFVGLDNDGNNVYDRLDPACSPLRIVAIAQEGDNIRISWETTGGRTDVLQASEGVSGPYTDVGSPLSIPGSSAVTTNVVEVGGATNDPGRYYRIKLIP